MASVVGYARLSTTDQARGLTLEQQVQRLKEAGAGEVLVDLMSGTSEARPRYRELLKRVKAGNVSKVVATRWDRLTRGATETCRLVDVFTADGAPDLVLLDDPMDLSSVGGRLQLRLLGAVAQAEVERISERAAAGKAHRKAKGLVDKAPFGMKQIAGKIEPDNDPFFSVLKDRREVSRGELVLEMIDKLEENISFVAPWRHIGEKYGIWKDRVMIQRLLINPALRGAKVGKRCKNLSIATWADVEEGAGGTPLVDPERHQQLEARIRGAQARRSSPDKRRQHVLSGKVLCNHCGRKMGRANRAGRNTPGNPVYRCLNEDCNWRKSGIRRNSISESFVFTAVFKAMHDQADALAALEEKQAKQQDQASLDQPEVQKLQAKRQKYLKLMADGDAPELQGAVTALDQQIAALMEAGMDWGKYGMPNLQRIRMEASLRLGNLEVLDKVKSGEIELGEEVVLTPPDPEQAVADWWRERARSMAGLEWTEQQIQHAIYAPEPDDLREGGNPLKPEDYTWKENPWIQLIREIVQEIQINERKVVSVKLNA